MSSPMVGRSRWTTAALSLVTFLCLAGVAALMVWGTSAIMPDGRQPANSGVKSAVPAAVPTAATAGVAEAASGKGPVSSTVATQDTPVEAAAAASAEPVLAPPDESGPYHAGWYNTEFEVEPYGVYRASIYYPARSDARFAAADASGAPYPGIVAANGYYGADWNITWLPRQLASHGYVALCFTPPGGRHAQHLDLLRPGPILGHHAVGRGLQGRDRQAEGAERPRRFPHTRAAGHGHLRRHRPVDGRRRCAGSGRQQRGDRRGGRPGPGLFRC